MNGLKSSGVRSLALWMLIAVLAVVAFMQFQKTDRPKEISITQFFTYLSEGRIRSCEDKGEEITGRFRDPEQGDAERSFRTKYVGDAQGGLILEAVNNYNASHPNEPKVDYKPNRTSPVFMQMLFSFLLPVALIVGIMFFIMRQLQSGGTKAMSFGKSRARRVAEGETGVTFDDVAGCEEAKEELVEIVDFLKDPQKYTRLGGKIPKGVLLVGAPGTGKTLLARAVAGEAKVPFFSISGSDFVEMFVGVGAARVRDLFEQGKKNKPCLIFVDEIDAVGRQRFAGVGGGHDEREQTLNQLLVEMDGFSANEGVILIAATNRPDVLDAALLRPGRFDRHITVDTPDLRGREAILKVHTRSVKLGPDVELRRIARSTPGFSGAHLANLVNEAALIAARRNKEMVDQKDMEEAKDRVLMGPERRSLLLSDKEKESTAYHEAGHALIAELHPDADPVHKVTIIPRGRALGVTAIHATEDRHSYSEKQLKAVLVYALGGRVAEEIKFGEISTGSSNDLQRVTDIAHRMVCEYGMSDRLGARTFGGSKDEVFYARDYTREPSYSDATAATIDQEIKALIDEASQTAHQLITERMDAFDRISRALLERETLDGEELNLLIEGKALPPLFVEPPPRTFDPRKETAKVPEAADRKDKRIKDLGLDPRPGLSAP